MLDRYENPLISRYASAAMSDVWGERKKFLTWRKLWIALAEAERELGLPITAEQIEELQLRINDLDLANAREHERRLRHDVMAHVHAYGDVCPTAKPIIHLGATSCCITDNADLMIIREALQLVAQRLAEVIDRLASFAAEHRAVPCLAYTHYQPAQPTTVGKRATLWANDFCMDLAELETRIERLHCRGLKGTTGTQASYLALFHGDHAKVKQLEMSFANKIGFETVAPATGQTYSRKVDSAVIDALSGIAQSAHKMATDLRLLAHDKEIEEPFEADQIGSSAMAYKRNPMRSERICSLARYVFGLQASATQTPAVQWLERTLDDSAVRRLTNPQAFLAIDAILVLVENVASGLVVYRETIAKRLREELPFMATENILMAAVEAGGDRQHLHELIRRHSQQAAFAVKSQGKPNDLLERLASDPEFPKFDSSKVTDPSAFVGRAPEQVDEFVKEVVEPIRKRYANNRPPRGDIRV